MRTFQTTELGLVRDADVDIQSAAICIDWLVGLQSLAAISKWIKADHHVERILSLSDPEQIYQLIRAPGEAAAAARTP